MANREQLLKDIASVYGADAVKDLQTPTTPSQPTMSQARQNDILNIYNKIAEQSKNPTNNTIPTLDPTTPTNDTKELRERMYNLNSGRTDGETKAIEDYLYGLEDLKANTYKQNYNSQISDIQNQLNDTTAQRTEGETKALQDYLTGLQNLQNEIDRYNAPQVTPNVVKKAVNNVQKTTNADVKKSEREQRLELAKQRGAEALKSAQNGSLKAHGYSLSPNEERDLERANTAIENAKKKAVSVEKKETSNTNNLLAQNQNFKTGVLIKTPEEMSAATPTPTPNNILPTPTPSVKEEKAIASDAERSAFTRKAMEKAAKETKVDRIDNYLNKGKLSKAEVEKANQLINDYERSAAGQINENAYTLDANENVVPLNRELTEAEKNYRDKIYQLKDKVDPSNAALYGLKDVTPGVGIPSAIATMINPDNADIAKEEEARKQAAAQQNPLAYYSGLIGGGLAYSLAGQNMMKNTKYGEAIDKLTDSGKPSALKTILADAAKDAPIDLALDTVPELLRNVASGSEDTGKDLITNLALNSALNIGGATLGNLDELKALKRTNIPSVGDDVIDNAIKQSNEAVQNIEKLGKQIPETQNAFIPGQYKNAMRNGEISREDIIKKTSSKFQNTLERLAKGEEVSSAELKNLDEIKYAEAHTLKGESVLDGVADSQERQVLQNQIINDYGNRGSARVDSNGKTVYDGGVDKDRKVIFVTGLPASGKSSTLANPLSEYFHARVLDSDDIKEMLPEFKNGLGANYLHAESKNILADIEANSIINGDNVVIPIVGGNSDINKLVKRMLPYQNNGYQIMVCQNDLPSNKAIGRALSRYATDGRYIPPSVLKEYGNLPQENYFELVKNGEKYGIKLSGYARVTNDVREGEKAIFNEAGGLLEGVLGNSPKSGRRINRPLVENIRNEIVTPTNVNSEIPNAKITNSGVKNEDTLINRMFGGGNNEPPTNDIDFDGKPKGNKVSETRTNTLQNSGINTEDELRSQYLDPKKFMLESETEAEQMDRAVKEIAQNPQAEYDKVMSKTYDTGSEDDVNKLFMFYTKLSEVARESGNPEAWEQASRTFKQIQELGTDRAKGLQAFAKWSRNTKEGIIADGIRDVRQELKNAFGEKVAKDVTDKILDKELINIDKLVQQAMDVGINTREGKNLLAQVGEIADKYKPKSFLGKIKTILMDNMLGNFRTLISRNAGGNVGYGGMETARQPITALYDRALSTQTGKRTRTGWSKEKTLEYLRGFKQGLSEELDDFKNGLHTAKDGENTLANAIELNSHAWSTNHAENGGKVYNALGLNKNERVNKVFDMSGKIANKLDDLVKHGLSVGDRPFYEGAYRQRLNELADLRKKGLLGADVAKLSDEEFNAFAEISARLDGLAATYQDDSAMANALMDLKKFAGDASKGIFGVDVLSQFSSPFVRTPGNIIDKAIDYSPLGFVKRYGETISDKIRGKEFNQQRFVDQAGRNVLGTAIMAGGYGLAKNGILNGAYSDDPDMKTAQKNSNMIEYGLNTGNGNLDISWLPVLGSDLIAGSAINDTLMNNPDASGFDAAKIGAEEMINKLFDASALQGTQRLLGGNSSYSTDGFGQNVSNTLSSGASQLIPSLVRQIANTTDPYQREIADGDRSYEQNSLLSGIPYVREKMLERKVDNEGNELLQNQGRGLLSRAFENMLLPGQYKTYDTSALDEEAMRLFNSEETKGEVKQFNPNPNRKDITTEDHVPTDAEYAAYKKELGNAKKEFANAVMNADFYKDLSDSDRVSILSDIYSGIKAGVKMNFVEGYGSDDKIANFYHNNDLEGALEYIKDKGMGKVYERELSEMGVPANDTTKALLEEGNTEELDRWAELQTKADEYGVTMNNDLYKKSQKLSSRDFDKWLGYEEAAKEKGVETSEKGFDAYKKGKTDAFYDEYKATLKEYDVSDSDKLYETWDKYGKQRLETAIKGKLVEKEKTAQKEQLSEQLSDYGLTKISSAATYDKARSVIPELTMNQFATTYKQIDTDHNEGIKQDELIAYFNNYNVSEAEAKKMWNAYGNSTWKKVPVLTSGKWKLK